MSQPPIFAFENLALQQGGGWLFQDIDLFIGARDRLALIGRNGTGKSSLLKILAGLERPDDGVLQSQQGLRRFYVPREPQFEADATVFEAASEGAAEARALRERYEQQREGDDLDALTDLINRLMPDARITAEAVNDNVILKGSVPTGVQAADAADIAGRFIGDPAKVISMVSIRDREQVMLKVRVVEMQRSMIKQLGVDPSGFTSISNTAFESTASTIASGASAGITGSFQRMFGGGDSGFNVSFQALERVGLVKTLAEPTLTAVSGETASFLAGGEFPIPIGQRDGVISLEFKEFGVGLSFTPTVTSKDSINLELAAEVSTIDPTVSTTLGNINIPGLKVRRTNT